MTASIERSAVTVVTATRLEERAARRALPADVRVVRAGVGLARSTTFAVDGIAISCGLAGGLRRGIATGTALIPYEVGHSDGSRRPCDPSVFEALVQVARHLGLAPITDPLLTNTTLVRGSERARYAALGFAGTDMETALITAPRLAAVRVVLDTPERELSEAWLSPRRVILTPSAWRELPWLMREAPRCAQLAARVVAAALRS